LHVAGPVHAQKRRHENLKQHVDLREHLHVRHAVLGILTVQAMAMGNDFTYTNEVELNWTDDDAEIQGRHLDSGQEALLSSLVVVNRPAPVAST
jgi:hypothetical protein